MELLTGAMTGVMGGLLNKLSELLKEDKLDVREQVQSLSQELEIMRTALRKVEEVPREQLDEQVKVWTRDLKELSYNIEDVLDQEIVNLSDKGKTRYQIADAIKDIKDRIQEMTNRHGRFIVDSIVAMPAATSTINPRLLALYKEAAQLVGIDGPRDTLIKILSEGDDVSKKKIKIVSIVGFGGLGKTTLAKVVFDKLKAGFDCQAFVLIDQNPDIKKVLKNILIDLDKQKYTDLNMMMFDERKLIDELRQFLKNKRYLIVIDDIWDIRDWKLIRFALVENNCGSAVITTTRNYDVVRQMGGAYELKPLSVDNSKMLFYGRLFGGEGKCPDHLVEISDKILTKCGGIPLAIITTASVLAVRSNMGDTRNQWHSLYHSFGAGLIDDPSMEDMRRVLSLSYYDLPFYLKNCLVDLSTFPEDYEIRRDRLIWRWIAQGFVQVRKEAGSFELGESCFNELIDRSLIQPICIDFDGSARACRVHAVVSDLINSLSDEYNFVTKLNNEQHTHMRNGARRLSLLLENSEVEHSTAQAAIMRMSQHVRSLSIFSPATNLWPFLSSFQVLRVLDLEGCLLLGSSHLEFLGNLFLLRYLGLRDTGTTELPDEIGNLQFLQTLDIKGTGVEVLPCTVVHLEHLMCLHVDGQTRLPVGIGKMQSLQELSVIDVSKSANIARELSRLANLRVLEIECTGCLDRSLERDLIESLDKMGKIQSIAINYYAPSIPADFLAAGRQQLRRFRAAFSRFFTLPVWINPSDVPLLSDLDIQVNEVRQEDLEILGRLPALGSLRLGLPYSVGSTTAERLVVGANAFPRLRACTFRDFEMGPVVFRPGAMPTVEMLAFNVGVRKMKDANCEFGLGLRNLSSLEQVRVDLNCWRASPGEVEEVETALRNEAGVHPNHPVLDVRRYFTAYMSEDDDDDESVVHQDTSY